jgi:hypothetical protein
MRLYLAVMASLSSERLAMTRPSPDDHWFSLGGLHALQGPYRAAASLSFIGIALLDR